MGTSEQMRIDYSESAIQDLAATYYSMAVEVKKLAGYIGHNYQLTNTKGQIYILKIADSKESLSDLAIQNDAMNYLQQHPVANYQFPHVHRNSSDNEITLLNQTDGQQQYMRLLSFIPGVFYAHHPAIGSQHHAQLGQLLGKMDTCLSGFDHPASERYLVWDLKHAQQVIEKKSGCITESRQQQQVQQILEMFKEQVVPFTDDLPQAVIHNDVNDNNLLLSSDKADAEIVGVIDFGDVVKSYQVNELAIACAYAILDCEAPLAVIKAITQSYHQYRPLNPSEAWVLFPLICARLATSVCISAEAIRAKPDNGYLLISVAPAWRAITCLLSFDAKTVAFELQRLCQFKGSSTERHQQMLTYRQQHLFKNLSVSYTEPLNIERGQGQFLLDENNIAYLDMVNNVCHVGHCHPVVVRAAQTQMARLNTNTRYLYNNINEYSQALLAKFPEQLSVVMFVNSGSEANELAMRLMQCYCHSDELIVLDGAYHGNTNKTVEISPYKFNGPGGEGAAEHIHVVPMSDPYRGPHKGMSKETGKAYSEYVKDQIAKLAQQGKQLGGFICESLPGVAGNIIMPDGYLKEAYQLVRAAGGICIADEVQVGFGRVGSHWWGFETQGVVPDIVTLGKPIGNSHPLAAVVTRKEIADAFDNGMEYFNTFGGNPVSCAIGKAVLEVIDNEQLRKNAENTGRYMQEQLKALQIRFPIIGDVRGLGLFIGAELVRDQDLTPATEEASQLIEWLKTRNILLSLDGPFNNVLKIKPPMVFNRANVDYFINQLAEGLSQISQGQIRQL